MKSVPICPCNAPGASILDCLGSVFVTTFEKIKKRKIAWASLLSFFYPASLSGSQSSRRGWHFERAIAQLTQFLYLPNVAGHQHIGLPLSFTPIHLSDIRGPTKTKFLSIRLTQIMKNSMATRDPFRSSIGINAIF